MQKPLNLLVIDTKASIVSIDAEPNVKQRLMDMGINTGAKIECVNKSPFGDAKAFLVKGAVIAVRNIDSGKITVWWED